ncbi:MAG TPA: hypothetical protein DEP99_06430 [Nitrospiraceae bacterium]|nr:hypothetical protein [Nitrospiraceae bacterium]
MKDCFQMTSIEQEIGKLLIKKNLSLSIAESCTGGSFPTGLQMSPKALHILNILWYAILR